MTDADVTQAPITAETPLALPRYQSHKTVEALKIEQIIYGDHGGGATIHPADTRYSPFKVTAEYVAKHGPRAGGYWVRYEDLYESFCPAKAFEEGNTLIVPPTQPTIAELEELLKAEPDANVHINPDGTVVWPAAPDSVLAEAAGGVLGEGSPGFMQGPAAQQPMPPPGMAAQNLYPQHEDNMLTTASDPDVSA